MATEQVRPKLLAIDGKVINIEKIADKTKAQFNAQLKANGLAIEEARLDSLYKALHDVDSTKVE